jgi:thiopeptide-type bacteriocin biosynthesis protein
VVASPAAFRTGSAALVRAVARPSLPIPPCPDLDDRSPSGSSARVAWLRTVWANKDVTEALQHSSPVLAAQVGALCTAEDPALRDVQRAALSVARYLLRAQHRATPFGLFAGVATAEFGPQARADWSEEHVAVGRAGAEWLAALVARLESCPDLLERLPVVINNTATYRGDRLIVPFQPDVQDDRTRAVEASLALTGPVRAVLAATRLPIRFGTLVDKLRAEFPEAGPEKARRLLAELIRRRVLITSLHAPSTETDALGYLVGQLDAIDAGSLAPVAETVRELHTVRAGLEECATHGGRDSVAARMRDLVPGLRRHPVALDLRLDAQIVLPEAVAQEIERAALILTRLSIRPYGTATWNEYHQRFYERYGIGTMVPLVEAVADSGTGYPDSYPGAPASARRPRVSARDDALVRLAQAAALDGRDEVILTDEQIEALDVGPDEPRLPPHLEIGVRVHAAGLEELQRGRFRLEAVSVSRGVGVSTGRFLSVLAPADRDALVTELADLPASDGNTMPAQLSFPSLLPESTHVTRSPQVLPTVISLQEHRAPQDTVLTPEDLAVGCDGHRMYLAVPERGHRVEAVGMHALNLRTHTPPLVRFLTELSRAQCAQVTVFDWGAATAMPFLPRLRYGRTVLAPARWRLEASELPGHARPRAEWDAALSDWRARRRLQRRVHLAEGDRRLFLDLNEAGHRALLRRHLDRTRLAVLVEAPEPDAYGWCGGRAHEVVVPLKATRPSTWPPLPAPSRARALSADQMQTPASSSVLLAALYGDPRRQDVLLSRHLPGLLEQLGNPPWWFIRFRDPDQHLRVRIALPDPETFAGTARTVSAWADELRSIGLLADLRYPTSYREMGRWGSGAVWEAAEEVFRADSRAILAQLTQAQRPAPRTLVVAHTVAIASAFLGSTEAGMQWLIEHIPPTAPAPVPRPQFTDAIRLADPSDDWSVLRSVPGGDAIVSGWADQGTALAAYRPHLPGPDTQGIAVDDVLTSLLHVHFVRHVAVNFPEEEVCLYLARAAALAWTARTRGRAS